MSRPGDWNCRSCSHLNFQRRESCQRCGEMRLGGGGGGGGGDFGSFGGDYFGGGRGGSSSSFGGGGFVSSGPDVRPGDWYCAVGNCGTHNFASRSSCFKCGAYKEESGGGGFGGSSFDGDMFGRRSGFGFGGGSGGGGSSGGGRSGWKSGDWICTRCNEHNFASRMECFRCTAPRDLTGGGGGGSSGRTLF